MTQRQFLTLICQPNSKKTSDEPDPRCRTDDQPPQAFFEFVDGVLKM